MVGDKQVQKGGEITLSTNGTEGKSVMTKKESNNNNDGSKKKNGMNKSLKRFV